MGHISLRIWLTRFATLNSVLAVFLLVVKHGFVLSVDTHEALDLYFNLVTLVLVVDRLFSSRKSWVDYLKKYYHRNLNLTLYGLSFVVFSFYPQWEHFDKITSLFVFSEAIIRTALAQFWLKKTMLHQRIILLSFTFLIALGTLILSLPRFQEEPLSFIDTLFVATSAVCVTGLSPIDISQSFTHLGHWALMGLFQLGGLGPITLLALVRYLTSKDNSVKKNFAVQEMLSVKTLGHLKKLIIVLFGVTLVTEFIGALVLYFNTSAEQDFFWALFHSISAFCNAGFSLQTDSLMSFQNNQAVILCLSILIVIGGLGFHVHLDGLKYLKGFVTYKYFNKNRERLKPKLELQSHMILTNTGVLIICGTLFFVLFEWNNLLSQLNFSDGLSNALFQSITLRTAGFNSIDFTQLHHGTTLLAMIWMVIGAGAVSTGGGLKVITVSLMIATIKTYLTGSKEVRIHYRTVPLNVVQLVSSVVSLYLLTLALTWFALCLTEPQLDMIKLLFESISAISTVGLSLDTTTQLSGLGKFVLCIAMLAGRIGPLTLLASFVSRRRNGGDTYRYPSGNFSIT